MPLPRGDVVRREVGARKPAAPPEPGEVVGVQFTQGKACHVNEGHAAGEAVAALLEELRRGAAEDKKTRGRRRAVGKHTEQGEEVGPALDLVEDDQPLQRAQGQFWIAETGQINR